ELALDLVELLLVGRKPQAPVASDRIAADGLELVERRLRPSPQLECLGGPVRLACHVVPRGSAAEQEASVAPARALCDPASVPDPHAEPSAGQRKRACAARDPRADD